MAPKNLKILIVDDDPAILDLFRKVLLPAKRSSSLSFDLVTCRQGIHAVAAVKQSIEKNQPFSAAFIDVHMPPGQDGICTAEQIRRLDKNVEILIMTGYSDEHPQDIALRVPPVHKLLYVQKPMHIQEIYQFASALGMKWHAERELQKLNKDVEQAVEARIREFKIINDDENKKALMKSKNELEHRVEACRVELSNALEALEQSEKQCLEQKLSLEKVNTELMETNQAVSVLVRNIDKKKEELEKKIREICNSKLMPTLKSLQKDVYCQKRTADLELVINYLDEITYDSHPLRNMGSFLTDQEMRVVMMIKNGLTSQQISDLLCISPYTVKTHRKNIRKKLKINKKNINLASYLKARLKL